MINIKFNADDLIKALKEHEEEVKRELLSSVDNLASATVSKIKELAQNGLSSGLRKIYLGENSGLDKEKVQPGVNIITLSGSAVWIDDGLPRQDMKTDQW